MDNYEVKLENILKYLDKLVHNKNKFNSILVKDVKEELSSDELILFFDLLDFMINKKQSNFIPRNPNLKNKYISKLNNKIERKNIKIMDLTVEELNNCLDIDEIITYFTILKEKEKETKKKYIFELKYLFIPKEKTNFELQYDEFNPYKILGVEEEEYTKDELLEIVAKRIKEEKQLLVFATSDKSKIYSIVKEKTDEILDAYNELVKKVKQK